MALPDDLLRQARKQAAEEGTTLTALLADALRLRLAGAAAACRRRQRLPVSRVGGGLQPWIDPGSNASVWTQPTTTVLLPDVKHVAHSPGALQVTSVGR